MYGALKYITIPYNIIRLATKSSDVDMDNNQVWWCLHKQKV